jgi:opacity protein-like surface antigen
MTYFKRILAAFALIGTAGMAQADEDFASLTYGKSIDKISKSNALDANLDRPNAAGIIGSRDNTWGARIGRQGADARYYATYDYVAGTHGGGKLRQENLLGSYDRFLPLTPTTKLFGGGTLGVTRLSQDSPGFSRDRGVGYAVGGQVGVLQKVTQNVSLEVGYRYLRSNASAEVSPRHGAKLGSIKLDSTSQTYLAANYAF